MTKFTRTQGELFGRYCSIEMKRYGVDNEFYEHKVIGKFKSNTWIEVPLSYDSEPFMHEDTEDVINVIQCGLDETKVIRVRLSDVKLKGSDD